MATGWLFPLKTRTRALNYKAPSSFAFSTSSATPTCCQRRGLRDPIHTAGRSCTFHFCPRARLQETLSSWRFKTRLMEVSLRKSTVQGKCSFMALPRPGLNPVGGKGDQSTPSPNMLLQHRNILGAGRTIRPPFRLKQVLPSEVPGYKVPSRRTGASLPPKQERTGLAASPQ